MTRTIVLPIRIEMGTYKKSTKTKKVGDKKKPFALNLNVYRNAYHHQLNDSKIAYKKIVKDELELRDIEPFGKNKIHVIYKLFLGTKRKADLGNILPIVQKYFEDAFVELGYIEDDNYSYIPKVSYEFGGVDKNNERVEITIEEIKWTTY